MSKCYLSSLHTLEPEKLNIFEPNKPLQKLSSGIFLTTNALQIIIEEHEDGCFNGEICTFFMNILTFDQEYC